MEREQWKSRLGFIWAAVGSAVGLGSIWRFPYVVGENGGATFILLYLLCLLIIGFPVLIAEITIGRATHLSPYNAFHKLGRSKIWAVFGKMTILTGFLVSTFYAVVSGVTLTYLIQALLGGLSAISTRETASQFFDAMSGTPYLAIGALCAFMALCFWILCSGVQKGIEASNKIMMPMLFVVLVALAIKGLFLEGSGEGIAFLFYPDWSKITPSAALMALGQAFFSLSLGQGTMVTYGSYFDKKENIPTTVLPITLFGVFVSILSGIAIFTIVYSVGMEPSGGPSLMFQTLPIIFSSMAGGYILSIAFFLLLFIAALSSEISALEPMISYFVDQWKLPRTLAVALTVGASFLLAIPAALSFGGVTSARLFGSTFFDALQNLCVNFLVPLGGFIAVVLVGWRWGMRKALAELQVGSKSPLESSSLARWYFYISIRYVAPIVILCIFFDLIGLFSMGS